MKFLYKYIFFSIILTIGVSFIIFLFYPFGFPPGLFPDSWFELIESPPARGVLCTMGPLLAFGYPFPFLRGSPDFLHPGICDFPLAMNFPHLLIDLMISLLLVIVISKIKRICRPFDKLRASKEKP